MEENKKYVFETPIKPEIKLTPIKFDFSGFSEPEKAEALVKSLKLGLNDTIREDENYFTINPKMILKGNEPQYFKSSCEIIKTILTKKEVLAISKYFKVKKEDSKRKDKIYYGITKRIEKLYKWDDENKRHIALKSKNVVVCEQLDKLHFSIGFSNVIYHLLRKDKSDWLYCYKMAWFNKPIPNIQKWEEVNDGEYRVLTDSEADEKAENYLTEDTYLWESAVKEHRTTDALEVWAKDVINMDGRGSILNGYDGSEDSENINGTYYFIYRNN